MKLLLLHSLTSSPLPRNMVVIFSKISINNNQRPRKFPAEQPRQTQMQSIQFLSLKNDCYKLLPPIIIRAAILTVTNQNPEIVSESQLPVVAPDILFFCCYCCCAAIFSNIRIRRHIKPKCASTGVFYGRFLT